MTPDDHSASRNVETLQRDAPHLLDLDTHRRVTVDVGDVLVIDDKRYELIEASTGEYPYVLIEA